MGDFYYGENGTPVTFLLKLFVGFPSTLKTGRLTDHNTGNAMPKALFEKCGFLKVQQTLWDGTCTVYHLYPRLESLTIRRGQCKYFAFCSLAHLKTPSVGPAIAIPKTFLKASLHRAILSRDKSCDRTAILRRQQIARVNSRRFHCDL